MASASTSSTKTESTVDFTLRLPPEVLVEIFNYRVLRPIEQWYWQAYWRSTLASICKRWKHIVYGTKAYWCPMYIRRCMRPTFVKFSVHRLEEGPVRLLVDALLEERELIGTARGAFRRRVGQVSLEDFVTRCLTPLSDTFPRVQEISIEARTYFCWRPIMEALAAFSADDLVIFRSRAHVGYKQGEPSVEQPFFRGAPRIRRIVLHCIVPLWWLYPGAYNHLTHLKILRYRADDAMSWPLVAAALRSASVLKLLELHNFQCKGLADDGPVTLPALKELRLVYSRIHEVSIVQKMVMPGLDVLCIVLEVVQGGQEYRGETNRTLYNLNPSMFQRAQHIDIRMPSVAMADMDNIVAAMVSATTMDFRRSGHYMLRVFQDLLQRPGFSLPALARLELGTSITNDEANHLLSASFARDCVLVTKAAGTDDGIWSEWTAWTTWRRSEGVLTWEEHTVSALNDPWAIRDALNMYAAV
ncbi:hypothetical protein B0H11DRAFT_1910731 [Mycena galericulata]|nr:hypothetical protein B0H11DRAFT_1910731 [Mycena galericulata]